MVNGMDGQLASNDLAEVSHRLAVALRDEEHDIDVAPIRAGMRARAVADACEALHLTAVLMRHDGRVLHMCRKAQELVGAAFRLEADHLVSTSGEGNRAIANAVHVLLAGSSESTEQQCHWEERFVVTVVHYRDRSPFQLLCGLLIFSSRDDRIVAIESMLAGAPTAISVPTQQMDRSQCEIA